MHVTKVQFKARGPIEVLQWAGGEHSMAEEPKSWMHATDIGCLRPVGLAFLFVLWVFRFRRVRADGAGLKWRWTTVYWADVSRVLPDVVRWQERVEHAVILVRAADRLALLMDSAGQAEAVAEQLEFLRSRGLGSPEDVPAAIRELAVCERP